MFNKPFIWIENGHAIFNMNTSKGQPPTILFNYESTHTRSENSLFQYKRDELHCSLCGINFGLNNEKQQEHLSEHRVDSILHRKESVNEKGITIEESGNDANIVQESSTGLIQICPTSGTLQLRLGAEIATSLLYIELRNTSSHSIHVTDVFIFNDSVAVHVLDAPEVLAVGEELKIGSICNYSENTNDCVVRYLLLPVKSELIELHRLNRCCLSTAYLKSARMPEYDTNRCQMEMISNSLRGKSAGKKLLNPSNYVQNLRQYIQLEEHAKYLELKKYDCEMTFTKHTLESLAIAKTYAITIPNVMETLPLLTKMDRFLMTPTDEANLGSPFHAKVIDILTNEIHIKVDRKIPESERYTYQIDFILNQMQFQMEERALSTMNTFKLIDSLFPTPLPAFSAEIVDSQIKHLKWFNENIKNNREQQEAVLAIVNGVSYPAPYLIFGPPGTGKTSTVTEAVCQLLHTQQLSRILVTATSNAAADELAQRLLKYLRNSCYFDHNVYRLYAANVQREVSDPLLLDNSNYEMSSLPDWRILKKFRVIVCTLSTAGRLTLELPLSIEKHFTHLFIDECGSATETATLIPIAVCSSMGRIDVHVILSGDPRQLGPVIQSKIAERMGFGESLIERLMKTAPYQRNVITKGYSARMLTQLVKNFRSHPLIINISNELFYNGDLVACAPRVKTHRYLGWWKLPARNVPIIFDSTEGYATKDANSTSWYNVYEVKKVIDYVNLLLNEGINGNRIYEEDIGIISPYKRQCHKIEAELRKYDRKVMTASVELFQGKEKPIIIVSTVRTGRQTIGFLDSPKRLNVLLTRAQALMILIGDPNVLQKDQNWYDVLESLLKMRVMIGNRFHLSATRPEELPSSDVDSLNSSVASLQLSI